MPLKSPAWKYFTVSTVNESQAICKKCGIVVSRGGRTPKDWTPMNLVHHLHRNHLSLYRKVKDEISMRKKKQEEAKLLLELNSIPNIKELLYDFIQEQTYASAMTEAVSMNWAPSQTISSSKKAKKDIHQQMIDQMWAKSTSWDTIDTPPYLLPSHHSPSDAMSFQMKEKVTEKLHQSLTKEHHFSFTMDIWSDVEAFLSLRVHFVDLSFSLQSRLLHISNIPILHTGENIRDKFDAMLEEWKISRDKVHCIVSLQFYQ